MSTAVLMSLFMQPFPSKYRLCQAGDDPRKIYSLQIVDDICPFLSVTDHVICEEKVKKKSMDFDNLNKIDGTE